MELMAEPSRLVTKKRTKFYKFDEHILAIVAKSNSYYSTVSTRAKFDWTMRKVRDPEYNENEYR